MTPYAINVYNLMVNHLPVGYRLSLSSETMHNRLTKHKLKQKMNIICNSFCF